jgi:drug/metabolite transporter (DMT)-like permease
MLSEPMPTECIAFFQNFFGFLWVLPFALKGPQKKWKTNRIDLQVWRVLASCLGLLFWYKAVAIMPMGQAVALNFTGPLITVVGACVFLGEKLTVHRLLAIIMGFLGGVLIVHSRYLTGEIPWGSQGWEILLPLGSASAFSICTLLNKKLTHYDNPLTIVAYLSGCMVPILGIIAWPQLTWLTGAQVGFLVLLGLLSTVAQFALTRSFVCNDLTFLLPFGSVRLIASALIGFLFFAQALNGFVMGGFGVIFIALLILTRLENRSPGSCKS